LDDSRGADDSRFGVGDGASGQARCGEANNRTI
jgi:hypothetical protein